MPYPDDRKTRPPNIACEIEAMITRIMRKNPEPGTRLLKGRITYGDLTDGGGHYDYDLIDLVDTPSVYTDDGLKYLRVNVGETGIEFVPIIEEVVTITTAHTVADLERITLVDASGGAVTVTLPDHAAFEGIVLTIKRIDSSANAVDVASARNIDGNATINLNQYDSIRVVSDGSTYWII